MNLSNYFWYFKSALTPRFCDEVIKYALEKKDTMALTGGYGRDKNKPRFTDHYFSGDYPVELIDQKSGEQPSQLSLLIEAK